MSTEKTDAENEQTKKEQAPKERQQKYRLGIVASLCLIPVSVVLCIFIFAKTQSLLLTLLVAIVMSAAEVVLILYSYISQKNDEQDRILR